MDTPVTTDSSVPTPEAATPALTYAGLGSRIGAQLIDGLIWFFGFGFVIGFATGNTDGASFQLDGAPALFLFLVGFAYFTFCEFKWGQTLGKKLLKIKVVAESGQPADLKAIVMRNLLRIVDYLPFLYIIGMVVIARSPLKQRVGDKAAHTVVIKV